MHPVKLRVTFPGLNARRLRDAERPRRRYHAERGNDQKRDFGLMTTIESLTGYEQSRAIRVRSRHNSLIPKIPLNPRKRYCSHHFPDPAERAIRVY